MSTSEEKKAPPYMERLQKEHCTCYLSFFLSCFCLEVLHNTTLGDECSKALEFYGFAF